MVASALSSPLVIPVDAEHNGKRAAGCAVILAGFFVPLILISLLIEQGWFVGILVGLAVAAGAATITERVLRHRWPSGRVVTIEPTQIAIVRNQQPEYALEPHQQVNALLYHFVVKRGTRIKKGWHVVVLALEQDDTLVPFYSFASPEQFEALEDRALFRTLEKTDNETLKGSGVMRRMLEAESYRNAYGAEMTLDQFVGVVDQLQEQFPQWMPRA